MSIMPQRFWFACHCQSRIAFREPLMRFGEVSQTHGIANCLVVILVGIVVTATALTAFFDLSRIG
jgi:hypothetical protein